MALTFDSRLAAAMTHRHAMVKVRGQFVETVTRSVIRLLGEIAICHNAVVSLIQILSLFK